MRTCKTIFECNREIDAYIHHPSGFPLLVGVDDAVDYAQMLGFIEADSEKHIARMSDFCTADNLANPSFLISQVSKISQKPIVWFGPAQAAMLMGEKFTQEFLLKLVDTSVSGSLIVICPFCCRYLNLIATQYAKLSHRIVMLPCEKRLLPTIELYGEDSVCPLKNPVNGVKELLLELEELKEIRKIPFICGTSPAHYESSVFAVSHCARAYELLCKIIPEIAMFTQETDGIDLQWQSLAKECNSYSAFAALCQKKLGEPSRLSETFVDHIHEGDSEKFLCMIAMKVCLSAGHGYINECVRSATNMDAFIESIYKTILSIAPDDERFNPWIKERKHILQSMDENYSMVSDYCALATIRGKDVLYYLSEDTDEERAAIIHALCTYKYSESELEKILPTVSPSLYAYLRVFHFDDFNTKVLDSGEQIHAFLTRYFRDYKLLKISNRQDALFIDKVEAEATRRTFTKLPARSMLVKKMDKSHAKPYFFDALGVEFLAFIEAKCAEYQIQADIQVAHCNLPSITSKNKEFYDMFPPDSILKEGGLDDLAHHGKKYDFQDTPEPLHIFDELYLLAEHLKRFSALLASNKAEKIIILSDHGASRLAVTYQSENKKLELEEKSLHSGRCCPTSEDPHIEFATYEDGFAVLANYERFSGSRKADVEVHGGATLEETLIPIITLTAKPKTQQAFFVEDTVKCSPKDGAAIKLYANPILNAPRIVVAGNSYPGAFDGDKHNVVFSMPDIKRKGHYEAELFDGNKQITVLPFDAIRKTSSVDDFGL